MPRYPGKGLAQNQVNDSDQYQVLDDVIALSIVSPEQPGLSIEREQVVFIQSVEQAFLP